MFVFPKGGSLLAALGTSKLPSRDTMMAGMQRSASDPVDLTKKLAAGALRAKAAGGVKAPPAGQGISAASLRQARMAAP